MFWSKKRKAEATETILEVPQPEEVEFSEGLKYNLENYRKIAEKIDFEPGAMIGEELKIFFTENSIKLYDEKKVNDYLDQKVAKLRKEGNHVIWQWTPLRAADSVPVPLNHENCQCRIGGHENEYVKSGYFSTECGYISKHDRYHNLVPALILETVKKINSKFPNLKFYISEITNEPDPFIMVCGQGTDWFIFQHWNEPGFGLVE